MDYHLFEINIEDIKDDLYLYSCFVSMQKIKDNMNTVAYCINGSNEIEDSYSKIYERNYIITMVSILSKHIELPGYINGEIAKSINIDDNVFIEQYKKIRKKIRSNCKGEGEPTAIFPDLVIHDNQKYEQHYINKDHQHLAIEAKTDKINKWLFFLDFLKLNYYLKALHFKHVVYLIVKNKLDKIKKYISEYEEEIDYFAKDRISDLVFFLQETESEKPRIFKIANNEN